MLALIPRALAGGSSRGGRFMETLARQPGAGQELSHCKAGRYLGSDVRLRPVPPLAAQVCDPRTPWNVAALRYNQQNSSGFSRNTPLGGKSTNKLEKCESGCPCLNNCPIVTSVSSKGEE